ncbi:MAG: hypothetical protein QOF00_743 [Pseudonocardiales bacterium]|nr:hypothetical protein [Pseudonocardiales bacterium]
MTRRIVALVDGALVDGALVDSALVDSALADGEAREEPLATRLLAHGDHDMARPDP